MIDLKKSLAKKDLTLNLFKKREIDEKSMNELRKGVKGTLKNPKGVRLKLI